MPMDRRTDEEKRETMLRDREQFQSNALVLVNELHDAGFSSIWLDSSQIAGDGHYYARVIVDEAEVSGDRFDAIMAVAEVHDAKVHLSEVWMNQQKFSRIMLWPSRGDKD